jgi:hypothetical protein
VRGVLSVPQGRSACAGANADADETEAAPVRAAHCDGKSTSLRRWGGALWEAFSGAEGKGLAFWSSSASSSASSSLAGIRRVEEEPVEEHEAREARGWDRGEGAEGV